MTNSGAGNALGVVISDVLPSGVSGSNLHQTINISSGQHISISVTAVVTEDEDFYGQSVVNTASFSHGSGSGVATATFTIENAPIQGAPPPDFGGSIKFSTPSNQRVLPNSLITYTLVLSNSGGVSATLHVTDVIGSYYTVFNALSFTQSPVGTLKWSGIVTAGQSITLNFVAKVKALTQLSIGHTLLNNTAAIDDGSDPPFDLAAPNPPWMDVYGIYLPLVRKNS